MGTGLDEGPSRPTRQRVLTRKLLVVLLSILVVIASLALASEAIPRSEPFEVAPQPLEPITAT